MEENKSGYIYIMFSGTQCKMGSFIRAVTHGKYNHVSVSLDSGLSNMYSFARLKRATPFCGGFVHEGAERYRQGENIADISVCRVNVGEDGAGKVRRAIESMNDHTDEFLYNMISAMLVPLHKKVIIRDSYTCVEFALEMLKLAGVKQIGDCYSAMELYSQLQNCEVYNGKYPDSAPNADISFCDRVSIPQRITISIKQLSRLVCRLVSN